MTEVKKSFPEEMIEKHGSLENAEVWFRQEQKKAPVEYRINRQVLLNILGQEEESFKVCEELMMIAPNDQRVLFNRGWHLIHREKFKEGFGLLENGRVFGSYGDKKPFSGAPIYQPGHNTKPNHVLYVLEGGLGDQIIQARFASTLKEKLGRPVAVACHQSLASVFSRIQGVGAVIAREAALGCYHEAWVPGMSAPQLLLNDFSEIPSQPYLTTHPHFVKQWTQLIQNLNKGQKLKVGIRWAGSPNFEHQQMRKFSPETLTQLKDLTNVQLFSFQRDNDLIELPPDVVDLGPFLKSWEDTAAALEQMDLVITSCTSVAHMSAALGKKTWVLVPVLPYYVWAIKGETSPWYESVKLYRQSTFGQWGDVADRIREDLKGLK